MFSVVVCVVVYCVVVVARRDDASPQHHRKYAASVGADGPNWNGKYLRSVLGRTLEILGIDDGRKRATDV